MKVFFKIILFLIFTYGLLYIMIRYYSWNNRESGGDFNYTFNKIKDDKVLDLSEIICSFYNTRGTNIQFQDSTEMFYDQDDYMKPILQKKGVGYFDLSFHIQKADSIRKIFRSLNITNFYEDIKDSLYEITFYLDDKYKETVPHSKSLDSMNTQSFVFIYSLDSNFYEKKRLFLATHPVRLDSVWYFSKSFN